MSILRLLIIDDSPDDADLLRREITRNGYQLESERVDTGSELETALRNRQWDIILSDWNMPQFSAPAALETFKRFALDIPFIIVSGSIDEESVVKAMKSGAHDFFAKDRLTLLVPAIERELREAAVRRERIQMQEQLAISERMASVGLLAAGVAHEINNPLAVLVGNLELAIHKLDGIDFAGREDTELQDVLTDVREAYEAAERIRNVAKDLRLFARSDNEAPETVNIQSVIESSLRMAQNEIRHKAQVRTEFSPVPPVAGNESRLGQVFLNLFVNAAQSITEGCVEDNEISVSTMKSPEGSVLITVRDTGSGMSMDVKKKLFSPFFTTKPIGTGTGLGLSICHRIITEMGGFITVESEVGHGTAFTVRLDAATEASASDPVSTTFGHAFSRRGVILVIDDESAIGILIQKVLDDHDITRTTNAGEALEWVANGLRFDVIFCDLMMPNISGMDFYNLLAEIAPEQAPSVIFLTGGTFTSEAREFLDGVDNLKVDKPFDIDELRHIVSDRLLRLGEGLQY
jgi:signal transduction histidine kinase